jgi:hypothetical protein
MRTLVSVALAGAIAAATVATGAGIASADWNGGYGRTHANLGWNGPPSGYDWHRRPHDHGWNPGAAAAGMVLGFTLGALATPPYPYYDYPPPPPAPYAYRVEAHINWCSATYPSYNAENDTWLDYGGIIHPCIGP